MLDIDGLYGMLLSAYVPYEVPMSIKDAHK